MQSCDRISHDHLVIGDVLTAVAAILDVGQRDAAVPVPLLAGATEFFSTFVEGCHEAKEEEAFFPALARHGLLEAETMRLARDQHEEGRRMLTDLRPVRTRRMTHPGVGAQLAAYVDLKRRHIAVEDSALASAADGLSAAEDADVVQAFDRIEQRAVGPGGRDVLLALAGALSEACRKLVVEARPARDRLTARDLIHPPQRIIGPDESLARASELMGAIGARELAVMQGGALVGMLSATDIEPHRGHLEWTLVRTAMTPDPVTIAPDAPVGAVARLLLDRGFNSVPVSTGRDLIGLVRRSDLLRLLADDETP